MSGDAAEASDAATEPEEADDTVPTVEVSVYQLSVSVSGRSGDDLSDVEETARRLLDHLVEQSERLEERRDGRGVS